MILKSVQKTFVGNFGAAQTAKTVVVTVLDTAGVLVSSGVTIGSVIELGYGSYGVAITFSNSIAGYIKFNNTTSSIQAFESFRVYDDFTVDTLASRKVLTNRWKIESNQLIQYDDDAVTPLRTYDLLNDGVADGDQPNERNPE